MVDLLNQIGAPLIAVVVPILVYLARLVLPRVPKAMLPVLAGALGPAIDWLVSWLLGIEGVGPEMAVLLGLAGTGLRELKKQLVTLLARND